MLPASVEAVGEGGAEGDADPIAPLPLLLRLLALIRVFPALARLELTLSKPLTGRIVCILFPTSPSRTSVPLRSCRAGLELFLP